MYLAAHWKCRREKITAHQYLDVYHLQRCRFVTNKGMNLHPHQIVCQNKRSNSLYGDSKPHAHLQNTAPPRAQAIPHAGALNAALAIGRLQQTHVVVCLFISSKLGQGFGVATNDSRPPPRKVSSTDQYGVLFSP